jgi:hypothetical protein
MRQELTAERLRLATNLNDSWFLKLYTDLMRGDAMSDTELTDVLRFAVLFLRAEDELVQRLGYRILLQYAETTGDFEPLHDFARARDLTPVVIAAERLDPRLSEADSLHSLLYQAHRTNFRVDHSDGSVTYRTRGQMELRQFNDRERRAVVVAPTSYGKSEMLLDKVVSLLGSKLCIVVPTRALIAQTRANLLADERIHESRVRIITHPDAFVENTAFIGVMTQERLQRLFAEQDDLALDAVLVDEAHAVLGKESRSVELAQAVLIARHRNPAMAILQYTPFVADPHLMRLVGDDQEVLAKVVNEHVKAEKYIHTPLGRHTRLYDQFLNKFIDGTAKVPADEIAAIKRFAGRRTLVYLNKPSQVQQLASRLAATRSTVSLSPAAERAIHAIGDLIHPSYTLIDGIRRGVLFHHGRIPDVLRSYIEHVFREDKSRGTRYLICNSTLLEGVNTPADCLILLSHKRGPRALTRSAFRNLAGRVGRFSEVFDPIRQDLDLLQPRVVLMPSTYSPSTWNVDTYLPQVADLRRGVVDEADNPLLATATDTEGQLAALEYLENVEPGAGSLATARRAQTEVGRLCFVHGVRDFDIFDVEYDIQAAVKEMRDAQPLDDMAAVVQAIAEVFLVHLNDEDRETAALLRLRNNASARRFYAAFLTWRARNEPYKVLIRRFLGWWKRENEELVFVGSAWGEEAYPGGYRKLWVRMQTKTRVERINLAVAKVKEEHDFVDFHLMRYIEILSDLGLLSQPLYLSVKYGTTDRFLIALLRTGFSPELARLVGEEYREHVQVDVVGGAVVVSAYLAEAMEQNGDNDVLVYEAQCLAGEVAPN